MDGLGTIPAKHSFPTKSVKGGRSKESSIPSDNIAPPMLVSDIVISPSISGHHRISLNEGNILLDPPLLGWLLLFVLLLLLFFKDVNDWAPKSEVAEAITASVAAAMMMSPLMKPQF
jgi:hypothetical protein